MSIEKLLAAQSDLEQAQVGWRKAEDELLRKRAQAIRDALDAGHSPQELMEALGVKRARLYAMMKQGKGIS